LIDEVTWRYRYSEMGKQGDREIEIKSNRVIGKQHGEIWIDTFIECQR
jgi:hypothetical protein